MQKRRKCIGLSHAYKVREVNRIYEEQCHSGLSNREILRRYIYPRFYICEKTFYNIINASADPRVIAKLDALERQLSLF